MSSKTECWGHEMRIWVKWWFFSLGLLLLFAKFVHAETVTYEHYPQRAVAANTYFTEQFSVSGAPSGATLTNVEAQFTYVAYNGYEAYLSARINRGSDPGASGGAILVSQGTLPPSPHPADGTYGYVSFTNWNGLSVNGNYYIRFSTASGCPEPGPTVKVVRLRLTYTVPSISPYVSVSPSTGPQGTTFSQPGSGFTPSSTATLRFRRPDGTEPAPVLKNTDGSGSYSHSWLCDGCPVGTYQYWAVDNATSLASNMVSFSVTSAVNPVVSVLPSSGPQGTTFSQPGSGFTPNSTATLHFRRPDGTEPEPVLKNTNNSGAYSHSWLCDACPVGTYQYWAVDNATSLASNMVSFSVTSAVNPVVSVLPSSGPQGTTFSQPGSGFTPNSTATLHFRRPDGSEPTPVLKNTDAGGGYSHSWLCDACPVGTYQYWAVDNATSLLSNTFSFTVTAGLTPVVSVSPSSGAQGTTFSQPGSGFTPNSTATLHFRRPDGTEPAPVLKNTDGSGSYSHSWLCDACPVGTYTYWAIDDASSLASNTVMFTVTASGDYPVYVPLYRLYKYDQGANTRDHFYTTSRVERDNAISSMGYTDEGIECYVSSKGFPGGTPLYRLYKPGVNSHYYTTSQTEKSSKLSEGYTDEGIQGYVAAASQDGLVVLHRLRQISDTPDHYFLSAKKIEYDQVKSLGYTDEVTGGIGYVQPVVAKEPTAHGRMQGNYGGVDLGSGAFRGLNSVNLVMRGRGPSLSFAHYYNSFDMNHYPYPMGPNWSHSLESSIFEDISGNVYVKWSNGSVSYFEKTGDGLSDYLDRSGNHDQVTKVSDPMNYGYDIRKKNQTVFKYRTYSVNPWPGTPNELWFLQENSRILLWRIEDWKGNGLNFNRDAAYGTLQSVTDGLGRGFFLYYSTPKLQLQQVQEKVDGMAKRVVSFTYNGDGTLASFTDARGHTTTYTYTPDRLLKSITYPRGNIVNLGYDADKRVQSIKAGDDPPSEIAYDFSVPSSRTATVKDPKGHLFVYIHDNFKLTSRRAESDPDPESYVYGDPLNPYKPTSYADKEGNVSFFEYDGLGNLKKITNAEGNIADFAYNSKNNILSYTEFHAHGYTPTPTTCTYDQEGNRLRSIVNPELEATWLEYDGNHQITSIMDGRGFSTFFTYDLYGNLTSVKNAEENITHYANDYAGRLTGLTDPALKTTHYTYDNNDNLISLRNPLNNQVSLAYNQNSMLQSVTLLNQGLSSVTAYSYDTEDRLSSVTNPFADIASFLYDSFGNLKQRYDYEWNLTTYSYDTNNRLSNVTYPDATVAINRDRNGSVTSAQTANGISTFEYNVLNKLQKYTDPYGQSVEYVYDNAGRLQQLKYPGGYTVNYTYDGAGRLKTVADWLGGIFTYLYDGAGNVERMTRPNGTEILYTYDNASRSIALLDRKTDGTPIASYSFDLDGIGNFIGITAHQEPLSAVVEPKEVQSAYDKGNRLISAANVSYTYDKNGNLRTSTSAGGTTFTLNYENLLTQISETSPPRTTQHFYDGFGNRIARSEGGITRKYVLDLSGDMSRILAETDGDGNVIAYYVYGLGLVSRITPGGVRQYYHYNHRGDTVALTSDVGITSDTYAYDDYGLLLDSQGTTANPFKFIGRFGVMDEGQDLYFMRARFYDAKAGRFLSEDPLGFGGEDWNLYVYSGNCPVSRIDPRGLTADYVSLTIGTGIAGKIGVGADYDGFTYFTIGGGLGFGVQFKARHIYKRLATDLQIIITGGIDLGEVFSVGVEHNYSQAGLSTKPFLDVFGLNIDAEGYGVEAGGGLFVLAEKTFRLKTLSWRDFVGVRCAGEGCRR